jgi:hypothetical protein
MPYQCFCCEGEGELRAVATVESLTIIFYVCRECVDRGSLEKQRFLRKLVSISKGGADEKLRQAQ